MDVSSIAALPERIENLANRELAAQMERDLFPGKMIGCDLPTFVIPIRPVWAQSLFDEGLAIQSLFASEASLILNWENVYYRSVGWNAGLQAPCRILWYVTKDKRFNFTGCIRACSQALEVLVLPAKEAYRRFRRLGV